MTVSWTPHRFTGGVLALDTANTVVLRGRSEQDLRPLRRSGGDRALRRLRPAASAPTSSVAGACRRHRPARNRAGGAVDPRGDRPAVSRRGVERRDWRPATWRVPASLRRRAGRQPDRNRRGRTRRSAIRRRRSPSRRHLPSRPCRCCAATPSPGCRICPNCSWLFVDRSRNSSRLWCDMAVCGNRQKASRHYHRRKAAREVTDA